MFSAWFLSSLFPFHGCCCCVFLWRQSQVVCNQIWFEIHPLLSFYILLTILFVHFSLDPLPMSLQPAFQLLFNLMALAPFPVPSWFNLPACGIMEVLGTVHMLSSSDLYPNVRATPQISAKRKLSAVVAKLAANGDLTKVKDGSPISTVHISRSRLIYSLSAKEFCWCIVRGGLYWFALVIARSIASHTSWT